ncbi:MAG: hypothetical protein PHO89_09645 [Methylacidiphilaceae bacterium]|nr:hypothetical protein [Candidatus Methylacidiphilaceae bacterium]
MLSIFREAPGVDGKPGPVSMRRVLAAFFALVFVVLALAALPWAGSGWYVFAPAGLCVVAVLFLLFFTTWADVAAVFAAAKNIQSVPAARPRSGEVEDNRGGGE